MTGRLLKRMLRNNLSLAFATWCVCTRDLSRKEQLHRIAAGRFARTMRRTVLMRTGASYNIWSRFTEASIRADLAREQGARAVDRLARTLRRVRSNRKAAAWTAWVQLTGQHRQVWVLVFVGMPKLE